MRICFTSDLHGATGLYAQLDDLLRSAAPDVVILGGGPAGASAAIYTARADLRTAVIDKGLAVVDMSRGRPAMKITEKGREEVEKHKKG